MTTTWYPTPPGAVLGGALIPRSAARAARPHATMAGVVSRRRVVPVAPTVDPVRESIRRAALGDEVAFATFYDQVSAVVYGTVRRVVRDPSMSDEVTQEVFVELWRLAPRYDPERGSPQSWAATIAHRRAVDRVRSEQAARNREEAEATKTERPRDEVVDEVLRRDEHSEMAAALASLTETQREAVTLAYYGGHTYREVATLLDVPEGTVKTRIRDALIRLRDQMGADA